MKPEMLDDRDLARQTLDQRDQILATKTAGLDVPALGLRVEPRSVREASGRRVEEPQQAAPQRTVVDLGPSLGAHQAALVSPTQVTPILG
jgi:hypothetical protein